MGPRLSQPTRVERNPEGKKVFVFGCLSCDGEVRYLQWKLARGPSFVCRRCTSRAKPPVSQVKEPFRALFTHLGLAAKRRGLSVALSFEDFLGFTKEKRCHYCAGDIKWSERSSSVRRWSSATNLDRKDNDKGYSAENCVVCCSACNKTRGDRFTYEEFVLLTPILRLIENGRRVPHGA